MNRETERPLEPRIQQALAELEGLVRRHYPAAVFSVVRGEDPPVFYLRTEVDLEDPDEVLDVVMERMLELELEEGLPVYVLPVLPLRRVAEQLRDRAQHRTSAPVLPAF